MIEADRLTVASGDFCLAEVSFRVRAGEYAVVRGPSGAGKTTLLEALCGLRAVTSGRVLLDGVEVTDWPPGDRNVGLVPQDVALFTTMSVRDNLAYGLRVRGEDRHGSDRRVEEVAAMLYIEALLDRGTPGLSGGEARRVAIGRAIAFRPKVLLLDEPLAGLDEAACEGVVDVLGAIRDSSVAVLHVTHDQREAVRLATRVLSIRDGRLEASAVTPALPPTVRLAPTADPADASSPARRPTGRSSAG